MLTGLALLAPAIEAFTAMAGLIIAGIGLVITTVLVVITAVMMDANRKMAIAAQAQLAHSMRQLNELERQTHRGTIDEIVQASSRLLQSIKPHRLSVAEVRRWISVMDARLESLPVDVQNAIRPAYELANDFVRRAESGSFDEISAEAKVVLVGAIAIETTTSISSYLARSGHPVPVADVPRSVAGYRQWIATRPDFAD